MLEIKRLYKSYLKSDGYVLKGIDFKFNDTGLYYLIGESGSGKSTFLKIISGIDKEYEGYVKYKNKELREMKSKESEDLLFSSFSLCLQEDELDYDLTVKENLLFALEIYDLNISIKEQRIKLVLEELELDQFIDTKLKFLSGGEVKRVNLARALIKDSNVLLLDEPLGPLDSSMRKKLIELFKKISKCKLVIVISHNLDEIQIDSNNVLEMKDGCLNIINLIKHNEQRTSKYIKTKRKRYSLIDRLTDIFRMFKSKFKHVFLSMFALSLALTSLGITLILTDGISDCLSSFIMNDHEDASVSEDCEVSAPQPCEQE